MHEKLFRHANIEQLKSLYTQKMHEAMAIRFAIEELEGKAQP